MGCLPGIKKITIWEIKQKVIAKIFKKIFQKSSCDEVGFFKWNMKMYQQRIIKSRKNKTCMLYTFLKITSSAHKKVGNGPTK